MGGKQTKSQFNNNMIIEHLTAPCTPVKFKREGSDIYFAKYNYKPTRGDELELKKGDKVYLMGKEKDGWWQGESNGKVGWFPCNYVDLEVEVTTPDYAIPEDILPSYQDLCRDAICTVKTLYPFQAQAVEEMSFDKDTVLDIIEKPRDDPDWWKARTMRGEIGLVPRNYVREINSYLSGSSLTLNTRSFKTECTFVNAEWFHGSISRHDCEHMLLEYGIVGDFLLRESESKAGDFSLSIRSPNKVKHFRIKSDGESFSIGMRTFRSMEDLISYYQTSPLITTENGDKIGLKKAFSKTGTSP